MYSLIRNFALTLFTFVSLTSLSGQSHFDHSSCATTPSAATIELLTSLSEKAAAFVPEKQLTTVPVTAHLISQTNGLGSIEETVLAEAIELMNEKYLGAELEFVLCGVNQIADDNYYDFNASQENLLTATYNVPNTINLYVAGTVTASSGSGLCGYTHFPGEGGDQVIIAKGCLTNGSTLAHEMGHYLGLYHTHGKTNSTSTDENTNGSNCLFAGDDVCDTPADPNIFGQTSNCTYTGGAAGFSPDVANLMSYAPSSCRTHFTEGQLNRAAFILSTERSYLVCGGLTADFTASETYSPCGDPLTVTFTHNGTGATNWTWDFGDGITASNETNTITYTYQNTGTYSVSLTVTDGTNYVSKMQPQLIHVKEVSTENYIEDFSEGLTDWSVVNSDAGNSWLPIVDFQYTGNTVLSINNYTNNQVGEKDILRSRSFDFSGWDQAKVSFKLSYKPLYYTSTFFLSDSLEVAYSSDCGLTYQTIYLKTGADLATTNTVNAQQWYPEGTNDWRTEEILLPAELMNETVHFCIINRSRQGNFMYFDDFTVEKVSALPAELISFDAEQKDNGDILTTWTTATEENVSHFNLQYSENGIDWAVKSRTEAKGFSSTEQNYDTTESFKSNKVWLRLATIDNDGRVAYSSIVFVENENQAQISIYPNPTVDYVQIAASPVTQFQLTTLTGKVMTTIVTDENGQAQADLTTLARGVYFLSNNSESFRIVKL